MSLYEVYKLIYIQLVRYLETYC